MTLNKNMMDLRNIAGRTASVLREEWQHFRSREMVAVFLTLVRKEIVNNLLNLRFTFAYITCTILLVGSFSIMLSDYVQQYKTYSTNRAIYERQSSDISNPWQYSRTPKTVIKEPYITKIFAMGTDKDPDTRADISRSQTPYFKGDFRRNPLADLFPALDMVFIVGVILSLLIFVLTYDAVSGEHEEGMMKLLLSCPVPRDLCIVAKWIGGFLSLVFPFVTSCMVMIAVLLFSQGSAIDGVLWLRILGIMAACMLYIATIFSLSILVSAAVKNSSTSILVLLLVWTVAILVIPAISAPAAHAIISPPPTGKKQIEQRWAGVFFDQQKLFDKLVKEKYGTTLSQMPQDQQASVTQDINNELPLHVDEFRMQQIIEQGQTMARYEKRVDDLGRTIYRFSPFGCLQNIAVNLACTGMKQRVSDRAALEDFSLRTIKYQASIMATMRATGWQENSDGLRDMPTISLKRISLADSLNDIALDIGILMLLCVLFFMGAFVLFLRMEI